MWKTTLFLLLAVTSLALNSYTHTATNYRTDITAVYALGALTAGDIINFLIQFPNSATGTNPTQFTPSIMDSGYITLSSQPSGFGSPVSINFGGSNTLSWTVGSSATYNFNMVSSSVTASLVPLKLTISKGGTQLVKVSDVLRVAYQTQIYLSSAQATWSVTKSSSGFALYNLHALSSFTYGATISGSASGNTQTYSNLAAGYYMLKILAVSSMSFSYQSDPYPCPYDSAFPDTNGIFRPCLDYSTGGTSSSTSADSGSGMPTRTRNIIIISVCSALAFAVVVFIIYKLKARSSVSCEEVKQSDPSYNSGQNNLSHQTNIKRGKRNSEMIRVELPDSLRKFEGY